MAMADCCTIRKAKQSHVPTMMLNIPSSSEWCHRPMSRRSSCSRRVLHQRAASAGGRLDSMAVVTTQSDAEFSARQASVSGGHLNGLFLGAMPTAREKKQA